MPAVLEAIRACGSLDYSEQQAQHYAQQAKEALAGLPENDYLAALRGLADYAVARRN